MDEQLKDEILRSIALSGESENPSINHIIARDGLLILELSKGLPRIKYRLISAFSLILSQPLALKPFNPFEIRCCLCRNVIRYPAWYYQVKYAVNHFHYFVCFDASHSDSVTAKCYRKP